MHDYVLEDDTSWNIFLDHETRARLDPNIRLLASLIDIGDKQQIFRRTGVRIDDNGIPVKSALPLFLDFFLDKKEETIQQITTSIQDVDGGLRFDDDALKDLLEDSDASIIEMGLVWRPGAVTQGLGRNPLPGDAFRKTAAALVKQGGLRRVNIPNVLQPCLQGSLEDIGLPDDRKINNVVLDGAGVVIGIIDDGCALAHRNFLSSAAPPRSRVRYLWDQNPRAISAPWTRRAKGCVKHVKYGAEIDNAGINKMLRKWVRPDGLIEEEGFYEDLGYEIGLTSHGTHVMDIAAGNGASLLGTEGVAKAADIIFVQLPYQLVDDALPLLDSHILEAVRYIFQRADDLEQQSGTALPVVINISYGGYTGSHDGTSPACKGIDDQLNGTQNRAVVISAGNGFEADCHAQGTVVPGTRCTLQWNLWPEDPTSNAVEIWYEEKARLSMALRIPGSAQIFPPLHLGGAKVLMKNGHIMGWIENVRTGAALPNVIRIVLNATAGEAAAAIVAAQGPKQQPPLTAPCPSGTWLIDLFNDRAQRASFHAWIGRDDWRGGVVAGHQQSRFAPGDADPSSTLVDLATGQLTICVGAHNGDTAEICAYSAAGPTRDGRDKPDITAPAEEDATHRGILCASSRRSQPTWFNGTSAAAPIVAGMVALIFQYNRDTNGPPLSPPEILTLLTDGAIPGELVGNKRQDVDPRRPAGKKQSDYLGEVSGAGKVHVPDSLP